MNIYRISRFDELARLRTESSSHRHETATTRDFSLRGLEDKPRAQLAPLPRMTTMTVFNTIRRSCINDQLST